MVFTVAPNDARIKWSDFLHWRAIESRLAHVLGCLDTAVTIFLNQSQCLMKLEQPYPVDLLYGILGGLLSCTRWFMLRIAVWNGICFLW